MPSLDRMALKKRLQAGGIGVQLCLDLFTNFLRILSWHFGPSARNMLSKKVIWVTFYDSIHGSSLA